MVEVRFDICNSHARVVHLHDNVVHNWSIVMVMSPYLCARDVELEPRTRVGHRAGGNEKVVACVPSSFEAAGRGRCLPDATCA